MKGLIVHLLQNPTQMLSYNRLNLISRLANIRDLELMTSIVSSTFQMEVVGARTPHPPCGWHHLLRKSFEGLTLKISSKICEWMKVEISFNVNFFKLYSRGREAK